MKPEEPKFNSSEKIFLCYPLIKLGGNSQHIRLETFGAEIFNLTDDNILKFFPRARIKEVLESSFYFICEKGKLEACMNYTIITFEKKDKHWVYKQHFLESILFLIYRKKFWNQSIHSDFFYCEQDFTLNEDLKMRSIRTEGKSSNFIFQSDSLVTKYLNVRNQLTLDIGYLSSFTNLLDLWRVPRLRKSLFLFYRSNFMDQKFSTMEEDLIKICSAYEILFEILDNKKKDQLQEFFSKNSKLINETEIKKTNELLKELNVKFDLETKIDEEAKNIIKEFYEKRNEYIHGKEIKIGMGYKYLNGYNLLNEFYPLVLNSFLKDEFFLDIEFDFEVLHCYNALIFNDYLNAVFEFSVIALKNPQKILNDEIYSEQIVFLWMSVIGLINLPENLFAGVNIDGEYKTRNTDLGSKYKGLINKLIELFYNLLIESINYIHKQEIYKEMYQLHQAFFLNLYEHISISPELKDYSKENLENIRSFIFELERQPGWTFEGRYMDRLPYPDGVNIDFIIKDCISSLNRLLD